MTDELIIIVIFAFRSIERDLLKMDVLNDDLLNLYQQVTTIVQV